MRRRIYCVAAIGMMATSAWADSTVSLKEKLQVRTDAVLAVMGYSVVPDLTTSTLSISDTDAGNPKLTMSQLAGGFTISQDVPLYLEGGVAYSRFDPVFAVTSGEEIREVPLKWTSVMLTTGVGWDFRVAARWIWWVRADRWCCAIDSAKMPGAPPWDWRSAFEVMAHEVTEGTQIRNRQSA